MLDGIVLRDRLYEAVLELTGIPRSQLDMLLGIPDPVGLSKSILQLITDNENRKIINHLKEVYRVTGKGAAGDRG